MPSEYIVPASTVVAAVLALIGVLIVNKTRKPVATQDLWEENRQLRTEVRLQSDRINLIEEKFETRDNERQRTIDTLSKGFNALYSYLERVRLMWGSDVAIPPFTESQTTMITNAREMQR